MFSAQRSHAVSQKGVSGTGAGRSEKDCWAGDLLVHAGLAGGGRRAEGRGLHPLLQPLCSPSLASPPAGASPFPHSLSTLCSQTFLGLSAS